MVLSLRSPRSSPKAVSVLNYLPPSPRPCGRRLQRPTVNREWGQSGGWETLRGKNILKDTADLQHTTTVLILHHIQRTHGMPCFTATAWHIKTSCSFLLKFRLNLPSTSILLREQSSTKAAVNSERWKKSPSQGLWFVYLTVLPKLPKCREKMGSSRP